MNASSRFFGHPVRVDLRRCHRAYRRGARTCPGPNARIGSVRFGRWRSGCRRTRPKLPPDGLRSGLALAICIMSGSASPPRRSPTTRQMSGPPSAWFAGAADVPKRGAALTPAWAALRTQVSAHLNRACLTPLMRFCSASGIAPPEVSEAVIDRFMDYRAEHTRLTIGLGARRALARSWNLCAETVADWPDDQAGRAADQAGRHPMGRPSRRSSRRH